MDDILMLLVGIPLILLVWVMCAGLIYLVYIIIKEYPHRS